MSNIENEIIIQSMKIGRDGIADMLLLSDAFFENIYSGYGIGLDGKRPFGNSDIAGDVCEIIGYLEDEDGEMCLAFSDVANEYAMFLYHSLPDFLLASWKKYRQSAS